MQKMFYVKNIAYLTFFEDLNYPILKSQVIAVLEKVAKKRKAKKIYLISFQELFSVFRKRREYAEMKSELGKIGISLLILPTLKLPRADFLRPKWYFLPFILLFALPPLFLMANLKKIKILHARSYVPMYLAINLKKILPRLKLIFDPRSPFPEENLHSGRWSRGSLSFKTWKRLEEEFLKEADFTIAISENFAKQFASSAKKIVIIPNNVDCQFFRRNERSRRIIRERLKILPAELVFVYGGSLGSGWNNPKAYAEFIKSLRTYPKKHQFLFLTNELLILEESLGKEGVKKEEYLAKSLKSAEMPKYLSVGDFGLNLMLKKDVRMSIKTAEYLACGLPIVTNDKVLGAKTIVEKWQVGLVLDSLNKVNFEKMDQLVRRDVYFKKRARRLAVKLFDTGVVAKKYVALYQELMRRENE